MSRDIDVAIVTFRRSDLVRRCLASLREASCSGASLKTVVVDNASGDGTPEMVRSEFPEVDLIANPSNDGFAAATNQAIRRGSAPFVLVLNPDAQVEPDTIPLLLDALEGYDKAAAIGPALITADGSPDHAARRNFPTIRGALSYFSGLDRVLPHIRQYAPSELDAGEVDAVNGAFMLVRRDAIEEAGLFDEGYWMYMEDLDLCRRFRQLGWSVRYEPSAVAWHDKGGSAGAVRSPRLNFAFHYGMQRFYRKWEAPNHPAPLNLAVYAGIYVKLTLSLARGWATKLGAGRAGPPGGVAQ